MTTQGATLLTHRGAVRVGRDDLSQFNPPARTHTWTPIKHSDLVEALHEELARRHLHVKREQYAVQMQGNILFGTLDLDWQDTGDYAAAIGLRTSNNKVMRLELALGVKVTVCDNLCFSGDLIALRRKHTGRLNLPMELAGALDRYQEGMPVLHRGIDHLKATPLSISQAKEMVFDMFRQRMMPLRLFHAVADTYRSAARTQGQTSWTLHNACTEHIKILPPGPMFQATIRLGQFFGLN